MAHLDDCWPAFLDLLQSDPRKASEQFYVFAKRLLLASPPSILSQIGFASKEDVIHEVVLHCVRNNFRVLRTYRNEGKPFAAWFKRVATRKALELKRAEDGFTHEVPAEQIESRLSASAEVRQTILIVNQCLVHMTSKCQILLRSAAEEFTPREIALLMGMPVEDSKKVSDDLRHCRKKLVRLLAEHGVELSFSGI